jgi:hypothetical protein
VHNYAQSQTQHPALLMLCSDIQSNLGTLRIIFHAAWHLRGPQEPPHNFIFACSLLFKLAQAWDCQLTIRKKKNP